MAGKTQEVRTIMYSVRHDGGHEGEVVIHRFPYNAHDQLGREKLDVFIKRGFTFTDPRLKKPGEPQVVVTQTVDLEKPIMGDNVIPDEAVTDTGALPQVSTATAVLEQVATPSKPPAMTVAKNRVAVLAKARAVKKAKAERGN